VAGAQQQKIELCMLPQSRPSALSEFTHRNHRPFVSFEKRFSSSVVVQVSLRALIVDDDDGVLLHYHLPH
jgi:hypothetical protein